MKKKLQSKLKKIKLEKLKKKLNEEFIKWKKEKADAIKSGRSMGSSSFGSTNSWIPPSEPSISYVVKSNPEPPRTTEMKKSAGLILKKAEKTDTLLKAMKDEVKVEIKSSATSNTPAPTSILPSKSGINLLIEEKLVIVSNRDGGLENMEVKGELFVTISDPNQGKIIIKLNDQDQKKFQYKTHPNINKQSFVNDSILALKDSQRAFPTGNSLGILKWRFQSKEESDIPFTVNCWPSAGAGGSTVVNIDYELVKPSLQLSDVKITIPIPGSTAPVVNTADGAFQFNAKARNLTWSLPLIDDSNSSGSMEFTLNFNGDKATFFPVVVNFTSLKTLCPIEILEVVTINGDETEYSAHKELSTEQYHII